MKLKLSILVITGIILVCVLNAGAETGGGGTTGCPDLSVHDLVYQSVATAGTEFTITFTVTNTGDQATPETQFNVVLPGGYVVDDIDNTVPPLQPGESITITITTTIPLDLTGFGQLQVILDPDNLIAECSEINNNVSGNMRILPPGVTPDQFWDQTIGPGPWYKISRPYIPPYTGPGPL